MTAHPPSLTVACVQMRSGADQDRNIASLRALVREAAGQGATYVQTPEMTGIVQRDPKALFAAISPDGRNPVFAAAAELAAAYRIWLHVGSTAVDRGDGRAANRAGIFAPDGCRVATYDKIHMFDVDLDHGERWRESAVYAPGQRSVTVTGMPVPTGLAICYDLRFPALFRAQAQAGATVLTCPSCFTRQTGEAHWEVLMRARAIETGSHMVAAAQGGRHEDGRETYGNSIIVDPWGRIVARLAHDEPGVLTADIDPSAAGAARGRIPSLQNERTFPTECVDAGARMASRTTGTAR